MDIVNFLYLKPENLMIRKEWLLKEWLLKEWLGL